MIDLIKFLNSLSGPEKTLLTLDGKGLAAKQKALEEIKAGIRAEMNQKFLDVVFRYRLTAGAADTTLSAESILDSLDVDLRTNPL